MAKFKKALALVLSLAMVLTLAPIASVNSQAAAKYKISAKTTAISAGKTYNVKVTGVKKGQYVKVARTAGVTVKYNKKTIKASKKVAGTGKALTFKVTVPDKVANYKSTIKAVIYNKNGKKAKTLSTKRTVKVSEFSIASVVSTTDAAAAGYKYIRATFTKAIDSLDASEIEISEKATGQIYSVEKVQLATNGKSADITLVGDVAAAGTTFLQANTDYVLNIKKSGATAHLDFNIPAVWANVIVYGVDAGKKQVSLNNAIFTLNDTIAAATDYNEILGRTVTVQYDKNRVINKLTVINETVEYGAFSLVDADNNGTKESIKNVVTKTVYPLSAQTVGDIKATTELNMDAGGALTAGTDVDYAKVTLNGNGTVRRISSITNFNEIQYVVSTKDDDIVNLKGTSFSLKDFNIIKGGKTITIKDIKEGDVVFMNTSKKLAEVFTEGSVTGKMTVYTDKIEVNGTRYDTKGDLVADKNVQAATNASLAKYAGSEVTVFFERNGDVAEIVVGTATKTADSYAVITKEAKVYAQGSSTLVSFTADDGTGAKDYVLDASKLTKVVSKTAGTVYTAGTGAAKDGFAASMTATTFNGTIKAMNGTTGTTAVTISGDLAGPNDMEAGQLIKLTKKEDGTIVGLEFAGSTTDWNLNDTAAGTNVLTVGDVAGSFKAGAKDITNNATDTVTLPGTTPVLLWDKAAKAVKATTYGAVDFSFKIDIAAPAASLGVDGVVRVDTTASVMAVQAIMIDVSNAGLQIAKTVTKRAVIVGATFDQSPAKKLVDLTVAYGNKADVKYTSMANDILESSLGTTSVVAPAGVDYKDWTPGLVVDLKETEDGKLVSVKNVADVTPAVAITAVADPTKYNKSDYVLDSTAVTVRKLITANDTSINTTIAIMNAKGTAVDSVVSWSDYCTLVRDNKIASATSYQYSGIYDDVIVATLSTAAATTTVTASAVVKTNAELEAAIDAYGAGDTIEIAGAVSTPGAITDIYSSLIIDKGASLTIKDDLSGVMPAKITNNGTLNFRVANTNAYTEIVNGATGVINVDQNTKFAEFSNAAGGQLNLASGKTLNFGADFTNEGAMTFTGDATIATGIELTNKGTITNKGTWTISGTGGKLTNTASGTITNTSAGTITNNGTVANAGTITQSGTVTATGGIADGTWTGTAPSDSLLATLTGASPVATVTEATAGTPAAGDKVTVTAVTGKDQYGLAIVANSTPTSAGTVTVTAGANQSAAVTATYTVGASGAITLEYALGATAWVNGNKLAVTIGTVAGSDTVTATLTVAGGSTATTATAAIS